MERTIVAEDSPEQTIKVEGKKIEPVSRPNMGMWIGAGVGAGIGSAALAAALLYATRNNKKRSQAKD